MTRSTGLVVELAGELYFIPSTQARSIVHRPMVTRVPGSDLGLAMHDGIVLAVVELAPARGCAVVCELPGTPTTEPIALVGLEVLEVGEYPDALGGVLFEGRTVPELDLEGILTNAKSTSTLPQRRESST